MEAPANSGGFLATLRALFDREIVQPLRDVDAESHAFLSSPAARGVDWKVIVVLITTAIVVTLQRYLDNARDMIRLLQLVGLEQWAASVEAAMVDSTHGPFCQLMPFFLMQFFGSLVVPLIVIALFFRENPLDYGIKLRGFWSGWWIYVLMLAVVMPFVVRASLQESFQRTYPYYHLRENEPLWPYFWLWEVAYMLQFFFLEFFFRGFMVHATRHRFGCYSIFVMTVPYCMIHFGKPLPETLGSIIAGVTLGIMSLKTRSIWMGTAVHVTVAFTMDMLALWHQGRLGFS